MTRSASELALEGRIAALEYEMSKLTGGLADLRAEEEAMRQDWAEGQFHTLIKFLIARLMVAVPGFDLDALRDDLEGALSQAWITAPGTGDQNKGMVNVWAQRNREFISACLPEFSS